LRVNSSTLSKFYENTSDEVAGVILTMNVDIKQSRSLCDLPLDNYDFDGTFIGSGGDCEDVLIVNSDQTFTFSAASGTIVELPDAPVLVTDQDGNPLGSGNVPSVTGGVVEVTIAPCEDANYIVEYANGTPIDSGTIPSGGSETIVVPNCEDATYNLDNTEGSTLFLGSIPSGDNETIIAPDGTANVKNTAGTTVATGLVPSGGSANITAPDATVQINGDQVATVASGGMVNIAVENESGTPLGTFDEETGVWVVPDCEDATAVLRDTDNNILSTTPIASGATENIIAPDGTATVKNTAGTTVATGLVPSGGAANITAPDATFSINSTQVATIPSGTSDSIQVRKESGSDQIGSLQGQHWRINNSAITLKDTANNTLSTTNVPATESAEIVAPDGTVNNSDSTYTASVVSGGTLPIPDSQINVNGVNEGDVVSVKTIDVNMVDEDGDTIAPITSTLLGNTLELEVVNWNKLAADMFEGRVLSDSGTFESKQCLINFLEL
jgi:hypothetical protein